MDRLDVFLSWSGDRSQQIATKLRDWLPDIMQHADVWFSTDDLRKGHPWLSQLTSKLGTSRFGIFVLTPENMSAPWIMFEAGAIFKAVPSNHCCPLLCGLNKADLSGPMASFQATSLSSRDDMLRLLRTINEASGANRLDDARLLRGFEKHWGQFSQETTAILQATQLKALKPARSERELLEELLELVRGMAYEPPPGPAASSSESRMEPRYASAHALALEEAMKVWQAPIRNAAWQEELAKSIQLFSDNHSKIDEQLKKIVETGRAVTERLKTTDAARFRHEPPPKTKDSRVAQAGETAGT